MEDSGSSGKCSIHFGATNGTLAEVVNVPDCKSAVFRLRWFESNCLNKCSIRLTVRTQDFHSCNRGSIPDTVPNFYMVCIAQLAESVIVVQVVVGSSPSAYPIKLPL